MAIYVGKLRLIECGQVAEEEQLRHDHIPALFYRRSAIPGDATPAPQTNVSTTTTTTVTKPIILPF